MGGIFSKGKKEKVETIQKQTVTPPEIIVKVEQPPKKPQIKQNTTSQKPSPSQQVQSSPFQLKNIRGIVENIGTSILSTGTWLNSQIELAKNSEIYQSTLKYKNDFNKEITHPFKQFYNGIPIKMTEVKLNAINKYTFNERFTLLNFLGVATAIGTFRKTSNINYASKTLRSFRNSAVMYLIGGLFLTPEIYNPVLN